jgi:DNA adenine methylase
VRQRRPGDGGVGGESMSTQQIKPIVKWAGGKRRVLKALLEHCPPSFSRYHEPFLGSGVLFFALFSLYGKRKQYFLSDANAELVNMYHAVAQNPRSVHKELMQLMSIYKAKKQSDTCYQDMRSKYNACIAHSLEASSVTRAAYFLFLNRTCFNGLWRVNASGAFNVPHGKYETVALPSQKQLEVAAQALRHAEINCQGFEQALKPELIKANDFIYADPPYCVDKGHSSFVSYTRAGFDNHAQEKLCRLLKRRAHSVRAHIMISNSSSAQAQRIYGRAFKFYPISVRRSIAATGAARITLNEALFVSAEEPAK